MTSCRTIALLLAMVLLAGAQTGNNGTAGDGDNAATGTEADIAEMKLLLASARRERVRIFLESEIARLEAAIAAAPDTAKHLCTGGGEDEIDELPHLGMRV